MRVILKYIIQDSNGSKIYRLLDTESGFMADTNENFVKQHLNEIDTGSTKVIYVKNINTFSGRTKPGFNDFETWCRLNHRLDLLDEFNTDKNIDNAEMIGKSSGKAVWWKCRKCGYEWKTILRSRTTIQNGYGPSGCPRCRAASGKGVGVIKGTNDFETWCSKNNKAILLKEYLSDKSNPSPNTVAAFSTSKVGWVCSRCGKHFNSLIVNRTKNNSGCPFCTSGTASYPELIIYNYMSELFNTVEYRYKIHGMEADIFIPELNLVIDYRGSYWHSDLYRQTIDSIKEKSSADLKINQIIIKEEKDCRIEGHNIYVFGSLNSKKMMQLLLEVISSRFNRKDIQFSDKTFSNIEAKSKIMKNNKVAVNNITITHPDILNRWDYEKNGAFKPESVTAGTKYKAWFKCTKCGNSYYSYIRKQVGGQGCPVCNGQVVVPGYNDLATVCPQVMLDWDWDKNNKIGIYPSQVRIGSGKSVYWKCHMCGYETFEKIVHRTGLVGSSKKPHRCMNCQNASK